ncbi:hypothetical protein M9Y10_015658 [Tritrichomonas musculus]|uniref:DUF3447 domain-containing protein n=1 Tax=Tritrichomonas musculus TaxID=1915356 RepID=A0ABR2L3S6_9EUKA
MNIQETVEEMKRVQDILLEFLNSDSDSEIYFQKLEETLKDMILCDKKKEFKLFLHLLLKLSNHHYRCVHFTNRIEQILNHIKEDIKQNFSNSDIFRIFKSNKRIILYLLEQNIITIDEYIVNTITNDKYKRKKYHSYFSPEIQSFKKDKNSIRKELPEDFYEKRKIGANDDNISRFIQQDSIDDFITYVNKNICPLNSTIEPTIYETNPFLNDKEMTLIEYAAFFGSIQIFKYLRLNEVKLAPSLWICAIHSNQADIIHILEENHIEPEEKGYNECLKESIKCHHYDLANYFLNNYLLNNEKDVDESLQVYCIQYYNFDFMNTDFKGEKAFYYMCKNDYYSFAKVMINDINDINMGIILRRIAIYFCNKIQK